MDNCRYLFFLILTAYFSSQNTFSQEVKLINKFETSGNLYSSPVVTSNDIVVFGGHDKHIYFFDRTKQLIKSFKTKGWIHASPMVMSNGNIILGSYDKNMYVFSPKGDLIDKFKPGGRIFSKVLELSPSRVVFGSNKKLALPPKSPSIQNSTI